RLAARAVLSLALIAIGLAICLIGGLLTISIIGAAVGIPLIIFGAAVVLLAVYLLFGGGKIKIIDLRRFY
ncbi:MAG: hypothetical protein HYT79_10185, partial [Elusimicrobia bacterium]|nr:hypothetical protein [Elusimicrobiota bacterium]